MLTNYFFNSNKATFLIICIRYLLEGVETAIIMPTLNFFLLKLDKPSNGSENSSDLGLALSAFNLSTLVACPIFGYVSDLTKSTKFVVILGNGFKIGGNLMYCFAENPYMIIASRFVVGIGYAPSPSMIGMLNQATPIQKRTHKISLIFLFRQFGAMVGPLCYFVLRLHALFFHIGPYCLNQFTIPTFFVSILWILHTVMILFFYHDLPPVEDNNEIYHEHNDEQSNNKHCNEIIFEQRQRSVIDIKEEKSSYIVIFLQTLNRDMIQETTIACLFAGFAATFVDSGLSALATPLSLQLFNWNDVDNNIYFIGFGFVTIISLLILGRWSNKTSDEFLVVTGQSGLVLSSFLLFFFTWFRSDSVFLLVTFILIGFLSSMSYPFAYSPLLSLISKLTGEKNKGFNLAILSVFTNIGAIMGYIWTTSLVDSQIAIVAVVTFLISSLPWAMFVASFKQFQRRRTLVTLQDRRDCVNERTSLLSHALG